MCVADLESIELAGGPKRRHSHTFPGARRVCWNWRGTRAARSNFNNRQEHTQTLLSRRQRRSRCSTSMDKQHVNTLGRTSSRLAGTHRPSACSARARACRVCACACWQHTKTSSHRTPRILHACCIALQVALKPRAAACITTTITKRASGLARSATLTPRRRDTGQSSQTHAASSLQYSHCVRKSESLKTHLHRSCLGAAVLVMYENEARSVVSEQAALSLSWSNSGLLQSKPARETESQLDAHRHQHQHGSSVAERVGERACLTRALEWVAPSARV